MNHGSGNRFQLINFYLFFSVQEQNLGIMNLKPPSANDSEFQPVFRSGSCSERGPKHYMEDEYICVDNLDEHLPSVSKLSTSGAFYGVCRC